MLVSRLRSAITAGGGDGKTSGKREWLSKVINKSPLKSCCISTGSSGPIVITLS